VSADSFEHFFFRPLAPFTLSRRLDCESLMQLRVHLPRRRMFGPITAFLNATHANAASSETQPTGTARVRSLGGPAVGTAAVAPSFDWA